MREILKIVVCGYKGIYRENGVNTKCYTEKETIDCIKASRTIVRGYKERREEEVRERREEEEAEANKEEKKENEEKEEKMECKKGFRVTVCGPQGKLV